jgi:hypothetical protein
MKVFIANTTKQIMALHYRLPELPNLFYVEINPGQQKPLLQDDLSTEDIDHVIKQHSGVTQEYFVQASKIDSTKGFKGMIYSIGEPVSADMIERCLNSNDVELIKTADEFRKNELAATALNLENNEGVKSEGLSAKIVSVQTIQDGGEGVGTADAFQQTVSIADK